MFTYVEYWYIMVTTIKMIEGNNVKVDFTLTYNPKEEYNEVGYHTTYTIYKNSILKNGFYKSNKNNEWLGEGVYFWDCEENALWWRKKSNTIKRCIFICDLKCKLSNYLDLDNEMDKFETYLKKYLKDSYKIKSAKPKFKNMDECRKFFCDLYCSHNNICILSHTFDHDIINAFGFKINTEKRRQICVRDTDCISITSVKE